MKFAELSNEAKYRAILWFNSEYDAYGVNGTKEYEPTGADGLENISDSNGWEWDENGNRIW